MKGEILAPDENNTRILEATLLPSVEAICEQEDYIDQLLRAVKRFKSVEIVAGAIRAQVMVSQLNNGVLLETVEVKIDI